MKLHFSEADLLETYYMRPGQSMPVMMHLADCAECAARYERLEAKMRGLHSCHKEEKPETFWVRQRMSIMRQVGRQRERRTSAARAMRVAAAAIVVLLFGMLAWQRADRAPAPVESTIAVQAAPAAESITVPADPWQSEELNDYAAMVEWESWVEEGDHSS